jgi:hypothetical protein
LGPATPFNVAFLAVTFVAEPVVAVGGTFVQYGLGGLIPDGQTSVALLGAAESAPAPIATMPLRSASDLKCLFM